MSNHEMTAETEVLHPLADGLLLKVYTALIILTGMTVAASVYFPGKIGIAVAMVVTPLKATLILMYFMHLKYERPVFVIMFLVAIAILALVMGLTFFDYLYR
jgi:cytochrome c oxidase subunit 4|nr:cytochrome C oxidase subunit IV family protein [Candidatus Krumholzibacteria bacterium]